MGTMTTVLICDDRIDVREGLTRALDKATGLVAIEQVEPSDLLGRYRQLRIDLALVATQPSHTGSVDTIRTLLAARPHTNVIAFGTPDDIATVTAAIAAGASGFLRWDPPPPQMLNSLTHAVASVTAADQPDPDNELCLSQREMQVLRGMNEGLSNGDIGRQLDLSEDTVKTHAQHLFRKLGARDRAQAVAHGFRRTLLT
jgi:DNA-binding NarL/FixJ family response regulator